MEGQTINRGLFDQLVLAVADGDGPAATEVMGAIHQSTGPVVSRQLLTDVAATLLTRTPTPTRRGCAGEIAGVQC